MVLPKHHISLNARNKKQALFWLALVENSINPPILHTTGNYEKESNWYTWPNLTFTIIDAENYLDADNKWQIRIKFKFRHRVYNYNGIQSGKHYGIGESNEISTEIYRHND